MEKSTSGGTGLETHVASTLAYAGGWVSGLILLFVEKSNRVVRFHAMQSVVTFGILHSIRVAAPPCYSTHRTAHTATPCPERSLPTSR
jgi:hypothetical protein